MVKKKSTYNRPFIRWAGGKQKLIGEIKNRIPDSHNFNNYFEPFLGAGSLFLSLENVSATISDINPQLINTYLQIQKDHFKVNLLIVKHSNKFKYNNNYYYTVREEYNRCKERKGFEQAARFIFLIHTNYNGMYRLNNRGFYNVPLGKTNPSFPSLSHLEEISKKLTRTDILVCDYKDTLSKVQANDFVYLDPPYPPYDWKNHQKQYTVNHFSKDDHKDLAEQASRLDNINAKVLISYPDIAFVREVYSSWNIIKLDTVRSISCKKERKRIPELIIKNY
jgi:DNA adenine methylase